MTPPDDAEAVTAVIRAQIEALRAEDFARAYSYASHRIKTEFPLADFEAMVRGGYGALGASASADVDEVEVKGDEAVARVSVTAPDGGRVSARYEMAREEDGWRVTGVVLGPTLTGRVSMNGRGPG